MVNVLLLQCVYELYGECVVITMYMSCMVNVLLLHCVYELYGECVDITMYI